MRALLAHAIPLSNILLCAFVALRAAALGVG